MQSETLRNVSKSKGIGVCQHGTHTTGRIVVGHAFDTRFLARRARDRRARGAGLGFRALYGRAPRTRAGRAFPNLARLGACANARRARGNGTLQDIFGHVGLRRAFGFQHVFGHVGHRRARGNSRLENPFAGIGFWTFGKIPFGFTFGFKSLHSLHGFHGLFGHVLTSNKIS